MVPVVPSYKLIFAFLSHFKVTKAQINFLLLGHQKIKTKIDNLRFKVSPFKEKKSNC